MYVKKLERIGVQTMEDLFEAIPESLRLERPLDLARPFQHAAPDAPPGAPIGDPGQDWLARPPDWGGSRSYSWSWDYWEELPPM